MKIMEEPIIFRVDGSRLPNSSPTRRLSAPADTPNTEYCCSNFVDIAHPSLSPKSSTLCWDFPLQTGNPHITHILPYIICMHIYNMFFPTAGPQIHSGSILELSLHQGQLDHLQPAAMDVSPKGWREGPRESVWEYKDYRKRWEDMGIWWNITVYPLVNIHI